jgi:PAS domain S-box-containing protein
MESHTTTDNRMLLEGALVDVSHLLVASSEVDLRDVLRIVCEAVGAEAGYVVTSNWGGHESLPGLSFAAEAGDYVFWHRDGHAPPADLLREELLRSAQSVHPSDGSKPPSPVSYYVRQRADNDLAEGIVIPILSKQDQFVGYLGITHSNLDPASLLEHSRVLSVFGDLLATYLARVGTERALAESERRWRQLVRRHPDAIIITSDDEILYANHAAASLLGTDHPDELLMRSFTDFLRADQEAEIDAIRRDHMLFAPYSPFEHEVIRLDGSERVVEAISTEISFHGKTAIQSVLRDISDRKASEERYSTFVQTISEGVWRLDLRNPVAANLDIGRQVEHLLEEAFLAETNAMMRQMMESIEVHTIVGEPVGDSLSFLPRSLFETFVRSSYRLQGYEFGFHRAGSSPRHFSINAVGRLDRGNLVRIWGSCVDITPRVEMERRMVAVLEEQQERIGQDLHDGVGQLLTGVRMLSDNLHDRMGEVGDGAAFETAKKICGYAEEASQRVREICRGLAPPQLFQEHLAYSLEALASYAGSVSEARCSFEWDGTAETDDREVKLQLYRIAQEAINNALKHSGAGSISVRFAHTGRDTVSLEIADDGCGFDVDQRIHQSLGIYSMQRRASSVRAALTIDSEVDRGTRIRVECAVCPTR